MYLSFPKSLIRQHLSTLELKVSSSVNPTPNNHHVTEAKAMC